MTVQRLVGEDKCQFLIRVSVNVVLSENRNRYKCPSLLERYFASGRDSVALHVRFARKQFKVTQGEQRWYPLSTAVGHVRHTLTEIYRETLRARNSIILQFIYYRFQYVCQVKLDGDRYKAHAPLDAVPLQKYVLCGVFHPPTRTYW